VEYDAGDHLDDHLDHTENSTEDDAVSADFSFGSDLAAALAATYLPDAADTLAPDTHATDTDATDIDEFSDPSVFPFVADPYAADALPIEAEVVEVVEVDEVEVAEDAPEPTDDDATGAAPDDEPDTTGERHVDDLPPIVWRADAFGNVDAVEPIDAVTTITEADLEPVEEIHEDVFVTAGSDWLLGNAVPLVEVQAAGALVMRRADERWALADVNTGADFALEVEVDFLSGPGLGVLFRASVDDEGRMSGYSFDVDPIYDGGGYLVRQWQDDRELWNPIARVKADDPSAMYGKLTVRIEVNGEQLRVAMNGAEVLVVDDLEQASRERDRGPATGDRVGVQAWSSSDLVIDALRVASR
jgi:hypothetical protein